MKALEQRVNELEKRIAELEGRVPERRKFVPETSEHGKCYGPNVWGGSSDG